MCRGPTVWKICFYVTNVLVALAAIAVIVVGAKFVVDVKSLSLYEGRLKAVSAVTVVVGGVTLAVALLGLCGVFLEDRIMLITYSVLLTLSTVLLVALLWTPGTWNINVRDYAGPILEEKFKLRGMEGDVFSDVEHNMQCCGLEGPGSYNYNPPLSCCQEELNFCAMTNSNLHREGCIVIAIITVEIHIAIFERACWAVEAVQVLAAPFAIYFTILVNNKYKARC